MFEVIIYKHVIFRNIVWYLIALTPVMVHSRCLSSQPNDNLNSGGERCSEIWTLNPSQGPKHQEILLSSCLHFGWSSSQALRQTLIFSLRHPGDLVHPHACLFSPTLFLVSWIPTQHLNIHLKRIVLSWQNSFPGFLGTFIFFQIPR